MSRLHSYVKKLTEKLQSSSKSQVYNALVELRTKVLKSSEGTETLLALGTISKLVDVLKQNDSEDQTAVKIINVDLSVLANLCMNGDVRKKVLELGGIYVLERYFVECDLESVQNRSCRALANLALCPKACETIHRTDVLSRLVSLLEKTEDKECLQTYCRAVRQLGRTQDQRERLVAKGAILLVAKHIITEDADVRKAAVRTVFELSKGGCSFDFAKQVVGAGAVKDIVTIATTDADHDLSHQCHQILYQIVCHPNVRPVFGAANGIQIFIEKFKSEENKEEKLALLNVLTLCSKESVNRVKLRENGALLLFLEAMQDQYFHRLHDRIISALVNFIYDESSFTILLEHDLIPILLTHLQRTAEFYSESWTLKDLDSTLYSKDRLDESDHFPEEEKMFEKFYHIGFSDQSIPSPEVSDMAHVQNEEEMFQGRRNIYSIDSPTYIAGSDWKVDDDFSGILCKENFENDTGSSKTSSMSPLSTVTYMSPEFSPKSSEFSPPSSPDYQFSMVNTDSQYPLVFSMPYSPNKQPYSPGASPGQTVHSYSPGTSPGQGNTDDEKGDIYSESDSDQEDTMTEQLSEHGEIKVEKVIGHTDTISVDKDKGSPSSATLAVRELKDNLLKYDEMKKTGTDDKEVHVREIKTSPLSSGETDKECQPAKRRKLDFADEKIENEDMKKNSEYSVAKKKSSTTASKPRDGPTITENHILIILSRISQMDDPSKYLVSMETMCCLLDYLRKVKKAEKRAARIVTRLLKNPLCFEKFLTFNMGLLVYFKLLHEKDDEIIYENIQKMRQHSLELMGQRRGHRSRSSSLTSECSNFSFLDVKDEDWQMDSDGEKCSDKSPVDLVKYQKDLKCSEKSSKSRLSEDICSISSKSGAVRDNEDLEVQITEDVVELSREMVEPTTPVKDNDDTSRTSIRSGLAFLHELSLQADSPFGRGVISHWLHRKGFMEKTWMKVSLFFTTWSKGAFQHYFLQENIWTVISLCCFLTQREEDLEETIKFRTLRNVIVEGLCVMGHMLVFQSSTSPSPIEDVSESFVPFGSAEMEGCQILRRTDLDVTLCVGNGKVEVSKEVLVKSSPLFQAMLTGHYAEASLKDVTLSDTTEYAVRYIVHYLHGCNKNCDIIGDILHCEPTNQNIYNCLETISLAHKYMLEELQNFMLLLLTTRMLEVETACHVFQFAKLYDFQKLKEDTVIAVFKAKEMKQRLKGVRLFLEGPNGCDFIDTISDVLMKC